MYTNTHFICTYVLSFMYVLMTKGTHTYNIPIQIQLRPTYAPHTRVLPAYTCTLVHIVRTIYHLILTLFLSTYTLYRPRILGYTQPYIQLNKHYMPYMHPTYFVRRTVTHTCINHTHTLLHVYYHLHLM